MKRSILLITALALLAIGLAGGGIYWLFLRRPAPPDIDRVGGTVLVYQVDTDLLVEGDPKDLPRVLRERLDPASNFHVQITLEDPDRVRIAIPRTGNDHDDFVRHVKELIAQVGHLEFRILANTGDDKDAAAWAQHWFEGLTSPAVPLKEREARAEELKRRAESGLPPPPPPAEPGARFTWSTPHAKGEADYHWVEIGGPQRESLQLRRTEKPSDLWLQAAQAREQGLPLIIRSDRLERALLYSRECVNLKLGEPERKSKGFDYFLLTRAEGPDREVTGRFLERANVGFDNAARTAVHFSLNKEGGERFHALTSANRPSGREDNQNFRYLAIILDGEILTAPRLQSAIGSQGQITGDFTEAQVNQMVSILRSGALPVRLKPLPVSETTVPARQ